MISRNRQGFTLVEILCVVVILGIAGAIIVPQLGNRDDLRAAAAARVLMADLVYAQNRAITYQRLHYVLFDTAGAPKKYALYAAPGLTIVPHPLTQADYVQRFGSGGTAGLTDVTLESAAFTGQTYAAATAAIAFDEMGQPLRYDAATDTTDTLQEGAITLGSGAYRLRISVEPYTGQITVAPVP